ncbi:hypothetical protein ACWGDX_23200 [Streptomyces sp. NPDC055025]
MIGISVSAADQTGADVKDTEVADDAEEWRERLARAPAPLLETPAGQTPSGQTPAGQTPTGQTPTGQTPAGQAPSGHAPSG